MLDFLVLCFIITAIIFVANRHHAKSNKEYDEYLREIQPSFKKER